MSTSRRPGKKAYLLITLFALLLVLFPFLFWYNTWFGRRLSDAEIERYFADSAKPRRAQHALVQIGERMSRNQDVSRWYPAVVAQSSSGSVELRQTAAWIMGQARDYPPFHEALLRLLHDSEPMVRRNAALSLAALNDLQARPELAAMLRPFTVTSPATGAVQYRIKPGDYVNPGTLTARVAGTEVRAAVPGEVRSLDRNNNSEVNPGDPLITLAADKNHVWQALRALYLVGQVEDLEDVERYLRPGNGTSADISRQASYTAQAIRSRSISPATK
jgi:biotin carboxyl carrier protein